MAHAVEGHLRGTAQRPRPFAWPEGPAAWPEREPPEAGHLCLTGLGWSLAQSLRRYAAWALELASAGALATVVLALLGPAGAGSEATAAALWVGIGAGALLILRGRDPLRQAESWGDAVTGLRRLARRHPLACALALPVLILGTLDEASIGTPAVVPQLLQLLPALVAMNLAGLAAATLLVLGVNGSLGLAPRLAGPRAGVSAAPAAVAAGRRSGLPDPRHWPARGRVLIDAATAPLSFVLCAPAAALLSSRSPAPPSLLAAAAGVVGLGALVATVGHRHGHVPQPRTWEVALAAGVIAGAATGAGLGPVLTGGLIGAAVGSGMEVALRVARSEAVLWRNRHQLPLPAGEVLYRLDGREMEITLEAAERLASGRNLRRSEEAYLTDDGWRVTQLSASCWEGTKGRAQLLGRRRSDLLGVIRILHPQAPGGPAA
ncbi:MAG: hypothetical protein ACLQGJ_02795 [Candidatus Dormibacteria bacterium]